MQQLQLKLQRAMNCGSLSLLILKLHKNWEQNWFSMSHYLDHEWNHIMEGLARVNIQETIRFVLNCPFTSGWIFEKLPHFEILLGYFLKIRKRKGHIFAGSRARRFAFSSLAVATFTFPLFISLFVFGCGTTVLLLSRHFRSCEL